MTITIKNYIDSMNKAEVKSLTCSFDCVVYLLGDWLTYNELAYYKDNEFIDLAIGIIVDEYNNLNITVWVDEKFIKDIQVKNYGNDLIYKLEQMEDDVKIIETKGPLE